MPVIPKGPMGPLDNRRFSVQALAALVDLTGWPQDQQATAVAVAMAESSGKWWVVNQQSGAAGLFQILPDAHPDLIANADDGRWAVPAYNSKGALKIYNAAGPSWKPWEAFTTGAHLAYLAQAKIATSAWQNGTRLSTSQQKMAQYAKLVGSDIAVYDQAYILFGEEHTTNIDASGIGKLADTLGGSVAQGVGDVPGIKQAASLASIAELAVGGAKWLANGDNVLRIVFVVLGGALVVGGIMIVAKPAIQGAAKMVPPIPL